MKCYLPDDVDVGHFVTVELQTMPHVRDTFTLICFKVFA